MALDTPWYSDWAFPLATALPAIAQTQAQPAEPAVAALCGCSIDSLALGAGIAEIILAIRLSCISANSQVVLPTAHPWNRFFRGAINVPHHERGGVDVPALIAAAAQPGIEAVILGVPDPVTGIALTSGELELIIESTDGLVIIDGTYQEFADVGLAEAAASHDRLILVRPLTLLCQAAPVAFAIGSPTVMAPVREALAPIPPLLQAAVHAGLTQTEQRQSCILDVVQTRQALYRTLLQQPGLQIFPSQSNFLCVRGGDEQMTTLASAGQAVRPVPYNGPLGGCWQLAITDLAHGEALHAQLLQEILARHSA